MTMVDAPVARTRPVSPSKLGAHAFCPLRYLYETERPPLASVPAGPRAAWGLAVHKLVEQCQKQGMLAGLALKQGFCERLTASLANGDAGGIARHAIERHGLYAVFPHGEIVRACQFVASVVARHGTMPPRPGPSTSHAPLSVRRSPFGSEVWLEDEQLDLAGKADLVYRSGDGAAKVVDFKTSRLGIDGTLREHFILQMVAYGLLVERMATVSRIVVELETPDGCLELEVDDDHRHKALAAIASVATQLPRGVLQLPSALATPGGHCSTCAYRVSCPAYLSVLRGAGGLLPVRGGFDILGTVVAKDVRGGMASVVVRRPDNSACRLDGIPARTWPEAFPGDDVSAFNVGCREVATRSRAPANFFVFRPDAPPASAYRAILQVS